METIVLKVGGMACGGCAASVRQALLALDGVSAAEVSHAAAQASVAYDPAKVGLAHFKLAVEAAGYKVI